MKIATSVHMFIIYWYISFSVYFILNLFNLYFAHISSIIIWESMSYFSFDDHAELGGSNHMILEEPPKFDGPQLDFEM